MEDLRVHIAPIGYDFNRVTEPLIKGKADKAYFILHNSDRGQTKFLDHIKNELKKKLPSIETKPFYLDIWNLYDCIQKFREIITKENKEGNHVFINVSTGTKITAIAGMLACMSFGGTPYYVKFVHPSESAIKTIRREEVFDKEELPIFKISKPKQIHLDILRIIEQNKNKIKKKPLIDELGGKGLIRVKDDKGRDLSIHSKHSQLRPILDSMENEWEFIEIDASGRRSLISLTEKGLNALRFF